MELEAAFLDSERMPRYFFDIEDHTGVHRDIEGLDLCDLDEAWEVDATTELSVLRGPAPPNGVTITVRDPMGNALLCTTRSLRTKLS
jgi:hypothetical protein